MTKLCDGSFLTERSKCGAVSVEYSGDLPALPVWEKLKGDTLKDDYKNLDNADLRSIIRGLIFSNMETERVEDSSDIKLTLKFRSHVFVYFAPGSLSINAVIEHFTNEIFKLYLKNKKNDE